MEDQVVLEKVKAILCDVLNLEDISSDATQEMYPEWDSLAYLSLVGEIEDEFGIEISADNINSFNSISGIVKEIANEK